MGSRMHTCEHSGNAIQIPAAGFTLFLSSTVGDSIVQRSVTMCKERQARGKLQASEHKLFYSKNWLCRYFVRKEMHSTGLVTH